MATTPFFDLLFDVPDIPPLIFFWLDPSSLALAACVCQKWRNLAQLCRGSGKAKFRLVLADLVADAPLLAWAAANLGKKQLPSALQTGVCTLAALKGALATLQWLREGGCEWDGLTCAFAAKGGHLVVLQWLRAIKGINEVDSTAASGTASPAPLRQKAAIFHSCSGPEITAVSGMSGHVPARRRVVTSRS